MSETTKHQILVGTFALTLGALFYAMEVCA